MDFRKTDIPDVVVLEPKVFHDKRGFFLETYQRDVFRDIGITSEFVQDNHSRSSRNVLRGMHYQLEHPQGKLVRVVSGAVLDVAVDLRQDSPTFGKWTAQMLSDDNHRMIWIPAGFAHGFLVLSDTADLIYKVTDFYSPRDERTLLWNDPDIGIQWPVSTPILSEKDAAGVLLRNADVYRGLTS